MVWGRVPRGILQTEEADATTGMDSTKQDSETATWTLPQSKA